MKRQLGDDATIVATQPLGDATSLGDRRGRDGVDDCMPFVVGREQKRSPERSMVTVDDDAVVDHGSQPVEEGAEAFTKARFQCLLRQVGAVAEQMS